MPEWYFLAFYAILRSIPNKQAGVAAVALVFFTLGALRPQNSSLATWPTPWPFCPTIADAFHLFWILGADCLILGWSGSHCTPHAIRIGQLWSATSFLCLATFRRGSPSHLIPHHTPADPRPC